MEFGRRGVVVFSMLLGAAAGLAQQTAAPLSAPTSAPAATPLTQPADVDSNRIMLDVVVAPKNGGAAVAGLTQQSFSVFDNRAPQAITSFRALRGSDAPVEVIVVIDAVNTSYTTIAYERGEIDKFFRANGAKLAYPTTLVIFTDTGTQVQNGFSTDGNLLGDALDHYAVGLRDIRRSAGIYGADERLELSIKALQQLAAHESTVPGRKLMLWVSPGWPLLSSPRIEISEKDQQSIFNAITGLSTDLRRARITLYSIDPLGTQDVGLRTTYYQSFLKGVRKPNDTSYANLALQVIAVQTGGRALNASNDTTALLQQAVADAATYYELSFDPAKGEPDEYHQIDVKVTEPGLVARTRSSYYSPR